jgi:hypothetical protein
MRALQRGDAAGRKRRHDVSVRLENPDEDPAEDDAILFDELEERLLRMQTPAAHELLARLATRALPVVEATLDGIVTSAKADEAVLKAEGPQCVLRGLPGAECIPLEVVVHCQSVEKGEKRKKR